MAIEDRIRERATELGFCKVGFTTMDDLPRASEKACERRYPERFQRMVDGGVRPRDLFPQGKSIVVLAYDYSKTAYPEKLLACVSRTYLSRSYLPIAGSPARERLDAFERFLEVEDIRFEPDRNALMMRPAALRAGVISFGRNNFAYVDGVGSFVILYGYMVDVELAPDESSPDCKCPPNCHACIDACPTGALDAPFSLRLERCVLFCNTGQPRAGSAPDAPPAEQRGLIGTRVHGCDACQEACLRNRHALANAREIDPELERIAQGFSLEKLLRMPPGFYEDYVYPIMYNYITDMAVHQCNAAVAMGNSGDVRYIPHLEAELANPDERVRAHVRWALDKLESCAQDGR